MSSAPTKSLQNGVNDSKQRRSVPAWKRSFFVLLSLRRKEWNTGDLAVIVAGKVAVAAFDKVVQGFAPAEKGKAHFIVEGQNGTALLVGMTDELIRFRV